MALFRKIKNWWYLHVANPVVARGERGAFKYVFRRYWLDVTTVSGNFKFRSMASEHPYMYLLESVRQGNEENVFGYAERIYIIQSTLTREQGLVNDIDKAIAKYDRRLTAKNTPEPEDSEAASIAEVKNVQAYVDASPKEKRKIEREANGRFKKALKEAEKHEG